MARRGGAGIGGGANSAAPAPSAFALSRIQAEGWRAGRLAALSDEAAAAQADDLNPYRTTVERARWRTGFDAARARR